MKPRRTETNALVGNAIGDIFRAEVHRFDTLLIHAKEKYLILSGDRDRSVICAVYHLFEEFLHAGFFWDGDNISVLKDIIIPHTHLVSEAAFEYRFSKSGSEYNRTYSL